ncbi:MAG: hypothetical protein ACREGC_03730, partial [Minisyncoccia bacterium]
MRGVIGAFLAIVAFVCIKMMQTGTNIAGVSVGEVLLALTLAYLIFSLGKVNIGQVGVLLHFGKPVKNLEAGLYFAPAGIYTVEKELGTIFEDELPADPEKIFREDDKVPVPKGMFPPIRVKFGQPKDDDDEGLKQDPYNVAMVAEVVPFVLW